MVLSRKKKQIKKMTMILDATTLCAVALRHCVQPQHLLKPKWIIGGDITVK
jgi:hypothetical protein